MTYELPAGLVASLACPTHGEPVTETPEGLVCDGGDRFPVIDGVPVMLRPDLDATLPDVFTRTRARLHSPSPWGGDQEPTSAFVREWIVRTNGNLYRSLSGPLTRYPIPHFPLSPRRRNEPLLDVGGNWGRWALAASGAGFSATVLDPNLDAAIVGRRIAAELNADVTYVVGDARALPFRAQRFGTAFSYSVLQHFDKRVAVDALGEMARVLEPGGRSLVQMPNVLGVRQATNLLRQRLAGAASPFRIRYWTPRELATAGRATIGPTRLAVDGFFSLNPRPEDRDLLPTAASMLVGASEHTKRASRVRSLEWLRWFADSVWVLSVHEEPQRAPLDDDGTRV